MSGGEGERQLILETTDRIFSDMAGNQLNEMAERGEWPEELWKTLEDTGLVLASISERAGGSGGDRLDSLEIIRRSAYHAAPLPLADTCLAAWLIEDAGGQVPTGPVSIARGKFTFDKGVEGNADGVLFAPWCHHLLCVGDSQMALVPSGEFESTHDQNLAGELQGSVNVQSSNPVVYQQAGDRVMELGAMIRSYQMAGALESVLEMAVGYATEREQFGRPLARFQAIQHQLAIAAGEVAAAGLAADMAGRTKNRREIAVAKSRAGEAAGKVAEIAHQVLGAIGYTLEHALNYRTRRLWCWRDDFGNETYWNGELGQMVLSKGGDHLWSYIVG